MPSRYLRVHLPLEQDAEDAQLLEVKLADPILQILCGRLVPHEPQALALAVLHPRRVSVYAVRQGGDTKDGNMALEALYSHALGDRR